MALGSWDEQLKGLSLPRGTIGALNPTVTYGFTGEPSPTPSRNDGGDMWERIDDIIGYADRVVCIIDPKRCQSTGGGTYNQIPPAGYAQQRKMPDWVWIVGIALLVIIVLVLILKK